MALLKNGNEKLKNYFNYKEDSKDVLKEKRTNISKVRLDAPLFSWPKDRLTMLSIINTYLANIQLDKIEDIVDGDDNDFLGTKVEYVPESEYSELPSQIYDIDNCTAKMLSCIIRLLNSRSKILIKIRAMKKINSPLDMVNPEIEKVVILNIVMAKYLPIINNQDNVDALTLKKATDIFESVCMEAYEEVPTQQNVEVEIKKNKEEQDFDIVSALEYVGVSVDKDDFGYYNVKSYTNDNGIKYYIGNQEKVFCLSKNSAHKFIDEFLNKPIETRKFITPGRVFISYINEAEKSLGINTHSAIELTNLFGAMNQTKNAKAYFKDVIKRYSRNAQEWKDFQKLFRAEYYANKETKDDALNRIHIKQQAKRLVIGEMFSEILNEKEILNDDQISISDYRISDISRDFGLDIDLEALPNEKHKIERIEDYSFRIINLMHSSLQDFRAFMQDIIDNYTVDYLRKEKLFLLQQDDQKEFIAKKKGFEDLIEKASYDKAKDTNEKIAYYQQQVDEYTQKIGNEEYLKSKQDLLKSKNNYRILLLNVKTQKELIKAEFRNAEDKAKEQNSKLSVENKIEIIKQVLANVPELIVTFNKGKATSWTKHKVGEEAVKREESLAVIDKIIEKTAAKISDESHQKILEENRIRESLKKAQKEERVKSVNAYINAYGSIVGNAAGVGAFMGMPPIVDGNLNVSKTPTFAGGGNSSSKNNNKVNDNNTVPNVPYVGGGMQGGAYVPMSNSPNSINTGYVQPQNNNIANGNINKSNTINVPNNVPNNIPNNVANNIPNNIPVMPQSYMGQIPQGMPMMPQGIPVMPMATNMPMYSGGMPAMPQQPNIANNIDYQDFDYISESIEPCVIPFIVGYENKGETIYGNMLEDYATFDKYKFLVSTNNNSLYSYLETKKAQIQSPEQIISDLHIRYLKNAMAKSGLATADGNLANFDYNSDVRKFLTKYVAQNMLEMVINDYNELISTINFEMLKDVIEHKFLGDLEDYIPDNIKSNIVKCGNLIETVIKSITADKNTKKTYEEYSSKMKQTYIVSLISKIESGEIPTVNLDTEQIYCRMLDYISFSIKGQNVIIQKEDADKNGLDTYPRSVFFKQKEYADENIKNGKILSYEQNEIVTTRNNPNLDDLGSDVVNLYGSLYKFNGGYNKLLNKLKPYNLTGGVKFTENLIDALKEKIDIKTTVIVEDDKKPIVPLVKFASKEKEKVVDTIIFDYDDEKWYIRKGFVLDKQKVKEYGMLLAFGIKYALDRNKTKLKQDFYSEGILSLNKINEAFKDMSEDFRVLVTSVIRKTMMSNVERFIDFITSINKDFSLHINKMLYISKMLVESNTFDKKNEEEKKETIDTLDTGFDRAADDLINPHPEIYANIEDIEHYEKLYLFYALNLIYEKFNNDQRVISKELNEYFEEQKKVFRNDLLAMIRDKVYMNGYEEEMSKYFELNMERVVTLDDKPEEEKIVEEEKAEKVRVKIKNIDVIFKGIFDGFEKAVKTENNQSIQDEIADFRRILEIVGTLPSIDSEEKELEIALPNNQTIICNIKGFIQQYLFRFIIDKNHELGPFAYVVKELEQHEELGPLVQGLDVIAEKLNSTELGINLIAKFSSISLSNNGNVFKIGDNISTVVEIINRLKTPSDMQKALNRDVFYKEGVSSVAKSFEQYFNRRKLENMK